MVSVSSKIKHESTSQPGVTFTVRRLNQIQRARRDEKLLEQRVRYSEMAAKFKAESNELRRATLDAEMGLLINNIFKPAYIRAGLIAIDGLEIDDKPATIDSLIDYGPEALVDEIYIACELASGLTESQMGNLQSAITSPAPEGGAETTTTVPGAESVSSTSVATA